MVTLHLLTVSTRLFLPSLALEQSHLPDTNLGKAGGRLSGLPPALPNKIRG